jgi:tyrosine-protein kinase
MTIAQYLRLLREQWIVVLLLTLFGALGAGAYTITATPVYQADTQLFVSTSTQNGDLAEMTQGSTFTQARVKSYAELISSPRVLEPVIRQLSLNTTPDQLAGQVTATSPLDTVLLDVTVTDTSPSRAAAIANSISTQFPALVNALETPDRQLASPVKVSITRAAIPPSTPVSPRRTLNLALGVLVGLGLGIGVAVLRDSLDRTVGSRTQVSAISGAPVLGSVADDPDISAAPLIADDAFSPRAEAFRQLRTNIRFLSIDHRISSLVVTGSVRAEGKTSTAANLAIALASNGEPVVLIDADLRRSSMADLFGLPGGLGLTSVLLGDVALADAVHRWRADLPLDILPAGPPPPNPSELIGSTRMADLIRDLTRRGITVIVDSPPLLPVTDAAILTRITDGALMVSRVGSTRVEQFTSAVESLQTAGARILGVVLNRTPRRGRSSYYGGDREGYRTYAPVQQPGDGVMPPIPAVPDELVRAAPEPPSARGLDSVIFPGPQAPQPAAPSGVLLGADAGPVPAAVPAPPEVDLRDGAPAAPAGQPPAFAAPRSAYAQHLARTAENGYPDAGAPNGIPFDGSQFEGPQFNGTQFNGTQFNGTQFNGATYGSVNDPVNGTAYGTVNGTAYGTVNGVDHGQPGTGVRGPADPPTGRAPRSRGRRSAPPDQDG